MTTLERVAKVFSEAFAISSDTVSAETTPDDVAKWDSLGHVNMAGVLEKEFGLEFEVDEIMEMASVKDILDVLGRRGVQ